MPNPIPDDRDNVPIPDPSERTVEAIRRDIDALRSLLEAKMDGRASLVDERFRGLDDKIALVVQLGSKELEAKLGAVEARLDRGDGKITGQAYKETSGDRTSAFVFAIIASVFSLISVGLALISIFRN